MADTLDIPEIQVIEHYPNDPEFIWHHRILLKRVSGAVWIALTPDLDLARHDLSIQEHVVLDCSATFPQRLRLHAYAHDFISRSALNNFKCRAGTQAVVLGDSMDKEVEELVWVIAMANRSDFGHVISDDIMDESAGAVTLDTRGVAPIEGEQVFVERTLRSEFDNFRLTVPKDMADLRLLGLHTDAACKRKLPLSDVVALMKGPDFDDFPLGGIRAAKEYHSAVSEGAGNFTFYHSEWTRLSGMSEQSAVSHVHCNVCEVLRLLHYYDQIDVSATAGGEMPTRWLIQSEISVERNPRHPDYSGIDIVISAPTTRAARRPPTSTLGSRTASRTVPPSGSRGASIAWSATGLEPAMELAAAAASAGAATTMAATATGATTTATATSSMRRRRKSALAAQTTAATERHQLPLPAAEDEGRRACREPLAGGPDRGVSPRCADRSGALLLRSIRRSACSGSKSWRPVPAVGAADALGFGEDLPRLMPSTTSQHPARIHVLLKGMAGNLLPPCGLQPPSAG